MPADRSVIIDMLKRIHLFRGADDDSLGQAADLMDQVEYLAGTTIYKEEDAADYFYFLVEGKVQTSHFDLAAGQEQPLGNFIADDYFGEEVLENNWPRQVNAVAITDVKLARLSVPNFILLLDVLPALPKRLQLILDSYRLVLKTRFKWLNPGETAYFAARRHLLFLFVAILPPILAGMLALLIFGLWYVSTPMLSSLVMLAISVPIMLGWLVWNYIDWTNDYYLITDQRIVYQERVVLLYDSRLESPLEAVQSTTISTTLWGRWLGYGNVAIRTYIGTILFRDVSNPEDVQTMVQEHQIRAQFRETRVESGQMKSRIDKRISRGPDVPVIPPPFQAPPPPDPTRVLLSTMFHIRYEVGGTVIFRTHWFILLMKTFVPSVILLGMGMVFIFSALNRFALLSVQTTCGLLFLLGIMVFAWWFYQYLDWHNDVYLITPDQIVDVSKKPLGREERQAAPIKNILSIEYKRLGIIGLLLNYGTVFIRVGDQKLTFDNVLNPSEVQRELFRRLAKKTQEEKMLRSEEDRRRIIESIGVYNELVKDHQPPPRPPQPPPRPGF